MSEGTMAASDNGPDCYCCQDGHHRAYPFRIQIVLRALNAEPIASAAHAAAMVGLSTSRLEHVFKQELGISMRDYLQERKLQKAHQLLGDLTLRIKEVRCLCGIPDASNFTHVFKQRFGMAPSIFRATYAATSYGPILAAGSTNK